MEQLLKKEAEFLNKFPKSKQKLLDWELTNIRRAQQASVKGLTLDYEVPNIKDEDIEQLILIGFVMNNRFMYDFLEEEGLFVGMMKDKEYVYYTINSDRSPIHFPSRKEAEKMAFNQALVLLEEKL
jgi:hypothetical protein